MSDDSEPNPEVDAIYQQAARDHERFVAESKEIDTAWAAGTLGEWLKKKLEILKKGDDGGDDNNQNGGANDAGINPGGNSTGT